MRQPPRTDVERHSYHALYYPYIHFKDEKWLVTAALYWDRMSRIVPGLYPTHDGPDVQALGDFVETIRPHTVEAAFIDDFITFIERHGERLRTRYAIADIDTWPRVRFPRPPASGGPSGSDPRLAYVFYEKVPASLEAVLIGFDLAVRDRHDARWLGMHPHLTAVYTTALARQLATSQGLHPLTDEEVDHVAIGDWTLDRLANAVLSDTIAPEPARRDATEVESAAACMAFETVVPDPATLTVENVLEFRRKYPLERSAFQSYVAGFVSSRDWLGLIRDERVMRGRIQAEYDKELRPRIGELREKLHDADIGTMTGIMGMTVGAPAAASGLAAMAGVSPQPVAAFAAGAALAVIPMLRDRRKARADVFAHPIGYLMRIERDLTAPHLMASIVDAVRKFVRR